MFKGLTKTIGLFLLLLFISGSFLISVFHRVHCDEQAAAGGDTHCTICHVINTPFITTHSPITLIAEHFFVGIVKIDASIFVTATLCNPSQARAPPVV